MKNITLIAIVSIAMYGCASSPASQTYGPYNVTGVGNTCNEARDNAFRIAVEQSFGTAVMAERQSKHDVLTRDEVLSHSSGFIDDYKILNTEKNSSGCTVKMTATVSPSMVNKYIFNDPKDSVDANGKRINAQVSTYLDERNRSDNTINGLFTDYVKRAYKLKQYPVEYEVDNRRQTTMIVPFEVSMNDDFLKKLNYTLSKVQEKCSATIGNQLSGGCSRVPKYIVRYIPDNSIIPSSKVYFFNDMQTPELIDRLVRGQCDYTYKVLLNIYNVNGDVIYTERFNPFQSTHNPRITDPDGWGYGVNSILWVQSLQVSVALDKFSSADMKRVELSLVDTSKKINGKCI